MVSGGPRSRSGPAPDPGALRREHDGAQWTVLPALGRQGDPPAWPLTDASDRELVVWARLWAKPQATQWEALGQVDEVALYVRRFCEVEQPGATAALGGLLIRMGEGLGLTLPGMHRLRWHLGASPSSTGPAPSPSGPPRQPSSRGRLRVVQPPFTEGA